jgi:hypothetical protein
LLSTNSVDYLAYYTKIGYSIRQVIDVISIWSKGKSIVNNLGNVCEIQCTNKWIDWCYAN